MITVGLPRPGKLKLDKGSLAEIPFCAEILVMADRIDAANTRDFLRRFVSIW